MREALVATKAEVNPFRSTGGNFNFLVVGANIKATNRALEVGQGQVQIEVKNRGLSNLKTLDQTKTKPGIYFSYGSAEVRPNSNPNVILTEADRWLDLRQAQFRVSAPNSELINK